MTFKNKRRIRGDVFLVDKKIRTMVNKGKILDDSVENKN